MWLRNVPLLACVLMLVFSGTARADDDTALANLTQLRQEYPLDVDHALARAQLLARLGEDEAALQDLRDAVVLAPDYEDVWRVRYALLLRQHSDSARRERDEVLDTVSQRFPDSQWWRQPGAVDQPQWTIVGGGTHETLDNNSPSWRQLFVNAAHERDWGRYRFGLARDSRFDKSDLTLSLGGDIHLPSAWSAGIDLAVVGGSEFQPDLGYSAYVARSLQDGWALNVRYQRREYATATVGSIISSVEKYVADFRFAYVLGYSHLHGATNSFNHTLTGNWYYSDRASIGINVNTGEESEAIGAGQVLQTDVNGLSVTGRRYLSDRMDLQWWLGTHKQGDYYRRSFLGMAVALRF